MIISRYSVLLILTLLVGCEPQDTKKEFITDFYSDNEIVELEKLVAFTTREMIRGCEGERNDCLNQYFDQFKDLGAADDVSLGISGEQEKEFLNNFDSSLFKEIWSYCQVQRSVGKDSLIDVKVLCINQDTRFTKFLLAVTKNNEKLKHYRASFETLESYSPSMNAILLRMPELFDFESKDELLLASVHILTLNYPEEILSKSWEN